MKNTFITIAKFQYSAEAHILRGKLASEGIDVFMADDITIDTDPLMSNAIGGVKLKVPFEQEEKAKEILNSIKKYSVDNEGKAILCPNCKSNKVDFFSTVKDVKSFFYFLLGFLSSALPIYTKYKYRCEKCKFEFENKNLKTL